jgi:hypothetical protein
MSAERMNLLILISSSSSRFSTSFRKPIELLVYKRRGGFNGIEGILPDP